MEYSSQFIPTQTRYEDSFISAIPEKYIGKLAKKGTQKREQQDRDIARVKCKVC
jgi:hypothetical protein